MLKFIAFYLMSKNSTAEFKVVIQDASLFLRKVNIADHVFLAHQQTLLRSNAIYPLEYVVMKRYSIPRGNLTGPTDNIFLGQLPIEMIIGFVDEEAVSGSFTKNPYNFKHMNVQHFVVKYDGVQVPAKPLTPYFKDDSNGGGLYNRLYQNLFAAKAYDNKGSLIQREDFPRGYALYAFDFRPDLGSHGCYNLRKNGSVQIEVQFREALSTTINMIVYAEFDSYFEITNTREVMVPS